MKYYHKGSKSQPDQLATGKTPNKQALDNARRTLLYHTHERQFGQLLTYQGYPGNVSETSENFNGDFDCEFYCVFPIVDTLSGYPGTGTDQIRIGADVKCWDYVTSVGCTNGATVRWDGVAGVIDNIGISIGSFKQQSDVTSPPNGIRFYDYKEMNYSNNGVGDYGYTKFSFDNLCPASVTMFSQPIEFQKVNSMDQNWGSQVAYLNDDSFNIGQALRGCDKRDDSNGSIGELCERGGAQTDNTANQVDSTARCLFQWGHPAGNYIVHTSSTATYINMFKAEQLVEARDLKSDKKRVEVLVVGRWDSGTKIRVSNTSGTGTSSATLTNSTAQTTPGLVLVGEIDVQTGGDFIDFECEVTDTAAVEIKTVAVFEKHNQF